MFSSVSAYLFGSGSNVEEYSEKDTEYEAVEADGDWLIVEPRESEPKLIVEEGESDDDIETNSIPDWSPLSSELDDDCDYRRDDEHIAYVGKVLDGFMIRLKRDNPQSIVSKQTDLTETDPWIMDSWFITPPSCFTEPPQDFIPTSSMENLLIEHPSMSVYARLHDTKFDNPHRRNYGITPADLQRIQNGITPLRNISVKNFLPTYDMEMRRDLRHPSHQAAVPAQYEIHDQVQKAKQSQERKYLHGKQLERHNKSQDFQSVGKRHRRKNFMKNPSGKSNNRKY